MTERPRLLIIGGDAAGMSAASQARRMNPELEIVAFERGPHTSYSACGIPYYVGDLIAEPSMLIARDPAAFRANGIDARILHDVEEIDVNNHALTVRSLESGQTSQERYDELVVATGARPVRPPFPGIDASNVFALSTLQDGILAKAFVDSNKLEQAVIIGGGYIGLEMAEACIMRGLHTTLIEQNSEVMATLDPDMGHLASEAVRTLGVELLLGERVEAIETAGDVAVAVTTNRRSIQADIVVLGIGVRPNASLAAAAGIPLGETGAIWVDERQRTRVEHVWAAGDCAESMHRVSRRPIHIALGTVSNKQGRICGINLGGGYARFPGVVGTATTKVGDTEIARTGLNESEARAAGFDFSSASISSKTRAGYFPGAEKITVKIVVERETERLLGAQIVGGPSSAKRIDTLAAAITAGMTATEFEYLDLSYAPPVAPVWEPAQIAARRAAQAGR